MSDGRTVGVVIDENLESLLTVVYNYYYEKLIPLEIKTKTYYQPSLGLEYIFIEPDEEKASKVLKAIREKFSETAVANISYAILSFEPEAYYNIFRYIVAGFKLGGNIEDFQKYDFVINIHNYAKHVSRECGALIGFVRFTETSDGVLYAEISPKNNMVSLLGDHFTDRLPSERWLIHDITRNIAIVYDTKQWVVAEVPKNVQFMRSEQEDDYEDLWSAFYKSVTITQRINRKNQMNHMPKRYWKHILETHARFSLE